MIKYDPDTLCKYGVRQEDACEDDCCQECELIYVEGKDIYCLYDPETDKDINKHSINR